MVLTVSADRKVDLPSVGLDGEIVAPGALPQRGEKSVSSTGTHAPQLWEVTLRSREVKKWAEAPTARI